MNDRARRKRLLPVWLVPGVAAALVVLALGGILARANYISSLVTVPDLVGRAESVARDNARLAGFEIVVDSEQFSGTAPAGTVLSQSPQTGTRARPGSMISVVLSAGSELVTMPDLIGFSLKEAQDRLRALGVGATTQDVMSPAPAGTVIESFPAPGTQIRTGETVRLSVAIGGPTGDALLPYDLTGVHVALDPAPVTSGTQDAALEVARRLRSLLEASGAAVTVTRSLTASSPPVSERESIITSIPPDACIGLSLSSEGVPGITPIVVKTADTDLAQSSESLAAMFMTSVRTADRPVNAFLTRPDDVLGKVLAPSVRILLGDAALPEDALRLADPAWSDAVARALYRALGETFAPR